MIGNHICQFYRKPKLIHLGSCATNFGDEIIKNLNFQKMVPNVVPGTPFRTPPGTPTGPNVLSVPKLVHLGSFATNFGDEIIESFNFQKMVPNVVPGSPFSTPPGTTMGPNFFLMPKLVHLQGV